MKVLHFAYNMSLKFDAPVEKHRFTLRCKPRSGERQEITWITANVYPNEFLSNAEDSFGNSCIYGYTERKHDHFSVNVIGTARTGLAPWETAGETHRIGMFRYQTPYTMPGPHIKEFAERFSFGEDTPSFEKARAFMTELYRTFEYAQGVTRIRTTAEEAMALGKGVCQDYSHIMLSLCRMQNIPARYVVGMLMGEGASHAWVEVYDKGRWFALDPTNNLVVDDQHIRISIGRDYADCTINQGVFVGEANQTQTISVLVREIG